MSVWMFVNIKNFAFYASNLPKNGSLHSQILLFVSVDVFSINSLKT